MHTGEVLWDKTAFIVAVVWRTAKQDAGPNESGIVHAFCKSWAELTSSVRRAGQEQEDR